MEAFPRKAVLPSHLFHPLGPSDITQCQANESSIALTLLNTCLKIFGHFLRGFEEFCDILSCIELQSLSAKIFQARIPSDVDGIF